MGGAKYWVQSTTGLWKIYLDLSFRNNYSKEIRMHNTHIDSHRPIVTQWCPILPDWPRHNLDPQRHESGLKYWVGTGGLPKTSGTN